MTRFFTIGHSNREQNEFLDLLSEASIDLLADVRKLPGSTRYPHFNDDALRAALDERGIEYLRLEPLTGRRPVSREVSFEVNAWWKNRSFHNYADHALSEKFHEALTTLRNAKSTADSHTAIMCSEAVWWRCHRRIIADYLLVAGERVHHILGANQIKAAELSAGAQSGDAGTVTYPQTAAPEADE